MPLTVESLRIGKATIGVKYAEDVVRVTYRAGLITPAWQAELRLSNHESVVREICAVVEEWDVTESGDPYPLKAEAVKLLPRPLLTKILLEILYDTSPGKTNAVTSDAG